MQTEILLGDWVVQVTYGVPCALESYREYRPFWLIGGPVELIGGLWKVWPLLVRHTCMLAHTWSRVRGWIENQSDWLAFLCLPQCLPQAEPSKFFSSTWGAVCETQGQLRPEASSKEGGDCHCWHLHRQYIRSRSRPQLENHSLGPNTHLVLIPAPLFQHCSPSGARMLVRERESTHLKGSPSSHLVAAPDSPSLAPSPTKVIAAGTPWERPDLCLHHIQVSTKATGHL